MSEKKLTAISVAITVRKLNDILCHVVDGKEATAMIEAYATQCVKEARERLVAEIKRQFNTIGPMQFSNAELLFELIDAAKEATEK